VGKEARYIMPVEYFGLNQRKKWDLRVDGVRGGLLEGDTGQRGERGWKS